MIIRASRTCCTGNRVKSPSESVSSSTVYVNYHHRHSSCSPTPPRNWFPIPFRGPARRRRVKLVRLATTRHVCCGDNDDMLSRASRTYSVHRAVLLARALRVTCVQFIGYDDFPMSQRCVQTFVATVFHCAYPR